MTTAEMILANLYKWVVVSSVVGFVSGAFVTWIVISMTEKYDDWRYR